MKKILISDYDQTFYLNDEDIEKNKIYVEKFRKEGNIFVLATGRSYYDMQRKIEQYNIKYDYLIINHGASILDENDEIVYNFTIKDEIVKSIKEDFKTYAPNLELRVEKEGFKNTINKYFCCKEKLSRLDFNNSDLTKINATFDCEENAIKILNIINEKYSKWVNCYKVSTKAIEIISSDINKSKAIKLFADYHKLDYNSIYTIGDGYSDIEMVKKFNGYAMKNCVEELKKVAKKQYEGVSELIINELI